MVALSAHAFFAGIAVGLSPEKSEFWNLVIAIVLHKWAAAMSLGLQLGHAYPGRFF